MYFSVFHNLTYGTGIRGFLGLNAEQYGIFLSPFLHSELLFFLLILSLP